MSINCPMELSDVCMKANPGYLIQTLLGLVTVATKMQGILRNVGVLTFCTPGYLPLRDESDQWNRPDALR
jgi:hypothetical protein